METISIQHTFVTSGATVKLQKDEQNKIYITIAIPGVEGEIPLESSVEEVKRLMRVLSVGLQAFNISQ